MRSFRVSFKRPVFRVVGPCVVVLAAVLAGIAVPAPRPAPAGCSLCEIIILAGTYELPRDTEVNCVTIGLLATLRTNGHTLTLTGPGDSFIDLWGTLELDSTLLIDRSDHTLTGLGTVMGISDESRIRIAADRTLTLGATVAPTRIEGEVIIQGLPGGTANGAFVNRGVVDANAPGGTVLIHGDTVLAAGPGKWKVTDREARLQFDRGNVFLSGDFVVTEGEMEFNVVVRTSGRFDVASEMDVNADVETTKSQYGFVFRSGASIGVAAGTRFTYQTYDASASDCENPDNDPPDDLRDPPFEIDGGAIGRTVECR